MWALLNHRSGRQTILLPGSPSIEARGSVAGPREGEGPRGRYFDQVVADTTLGQDSFEQAESRMQLLAVRHALRKAAVREQDVDLMLGGDLLGQCMATNFCARELDIPFWGVYGACSTMAEILSIASLAVDGGFSRRALAVTSSHFAGAERQFRQPLEYGGQRTPTAQWTVTGAAAFLLGPSDSPPYVTAVTIGRVMDLGVKDPSNMGAAMAPAFADTVISHFRDTGLGPEAYDLIVSGDLGAVGKALAGDLLTRAGYDPGHRLWDCGTLIYDQNRQDVHAGGSGCGCSALVLAGHLLREMEAGKYRRVLFCGTGALLSPVSSGQGLSIPGICHGVSISMERGNPTCS